MNNRGFALCSYARSGTNLLCRAMEATGKLGSAQEFFHPRAMQIPGGKPYPKSPTGQITQILSEGRTANGVYGVKIFCRDIDHLFAFDWVQALPKLQFVHLERRDILRQAISCVRANQTGQWHGGQPVNAAPHFDLRAISNELTRFARDRARWQLFFARNGISPLWLVYEDLEKDLSAAIRNIADLVGVPDLPDILPPGPKFTVQRDSLTEEWRERFFDEVRDFTLLDQPDLPLVEKLRSMAALQFHRVRQ
jgi:trehalose 2-sulfotransferase